MSRYIDADALINDLLQSTSIDWHNYVVDVQEVRHGRWEELYENNYKCSVCGSWWTCEETPIESGMSYCPNCGARMDSNAIQHTECVGNALDALDEGEE